MYVFGAEVSAAQREMLQRALDMGTRYIRTALSREMPPTTVYAHTDIEAMIRTSAQTKPRSLDDARALWGSGSQFGEVDYRVLWIGPPWFARSEPGRSKIAVHEAVHVLQSELAGPGSLGGRDDEVPRAGPKWLFEGAAEWTAYQAIAANGMTSISAARAQWVATTKRESSTSLPSLEIRGGRPVGAYDIYALAVDYLVTGRNPATLLTYLEAIGRGTPWRDAFATTFGKSVDAFYAEFEAYRRGL